MEKASDKRRRWSQGLRRKEPCRYVGVKVVQAEKSNKCPGHKVEFLTCSKSTEKEAGVSDGE